MTKNTASDDELGKLHSALAKVLAEKIKSGEATAADLGVARQFLKDNGIDAVPAKGTQLEKLMDALPYESMESVDSEKFN